MIFNDFKFILVGFCVVILEFDISKGSVTLDKSTQQQTECPLLVICSLRVFELLNPKSIESRAKCIFLKFHVVYITFHVVSVIILQSYI